MAKFRRAACVVLLSAPLLAAPPPRAWAPNAFTPLTAERIAALPAAERPAWEAYWASSEKLIAQLPERPKPDASSFVKLDAAPKGGAHIRGLQLKAEANWYRSGEARAIADRVVAAQLPAGGWQKGNDYTGATPPGATAHAGWSSGTFDNDATIAELRFLAQMISSAGEKQANPAWRTAFDAGLRYLFAAQYPNGGFPQIYPVIGGYHDGVTFNDDAMAQVLEVLRDAGDGREPFGFVTDPVREECRARFARGVQCILATQLHGPDGRLTVWCQQYDPLTLRAAAARNFEPIADCARESATLVSLLMSLPRPTPGVVAAVDGAVAWFKATALHDLKVARAPADLRGEAIAAPGAPPLWARFYEPGTMTPIFGDRDRTIHYDLREVSGERVRGYGWYTDAPSAVLARYAKWRAKATR